MNAWVPFTSSVAVAGETFIVVNTGVVVGVGVGVGGSCPFSL